MADRLWDVVEEDLVEKKLEVIIGAWDVGVDQIDNGVCGVCVQSCCFVLDCVFDCVANVAWEVVLLGLGWDWLVSWVIGWWWV